MRAVRENIFRMTRIPHLPPLKRDFSCSLNHFIARGMHQDYWERFVIRLQVLFHCTRKTRPRIDSSLNPRIRRAAARTMVGTLFTTYVHAAEHLHRAIRLSRMVRVRESRYEAWAVRENTSRTTRASCLPSRTVLLSSTLADFVRGRRACPSIGISIRKHVTGRREPRRLEARWQERAEFLFAVLSDDMSSPQ